MAESQGIFRDATGANLDAYRWNARPVLVFAPAPGHADYDRQMDILRNAEGGLAERDIVVLGDTARATTALRKSFAPENFLVVLIGKDGGVKLSRTEPISADMLFDTIDAMPMRRREMREE
ncbi:hypothetical protein OCH239_06580 [Roseivivax halodurans JCM 10272]|uniref:DUF4174 domain-containing protein n=1 Tax=Roseivivax halodurans JCM 10272 TaxID=1449350 RepID=X7EDA1_9RHOB|nr:DUF4174 domain-containing protein [Roseivivax halodurans]ETX13855.1 hypothetical protein OCH239_06580 [Roseivivax halodurans JCM 10272]